MKKLFTFLTTLFLLTACNNEDDIKIHLTEKNISLERIETDFGIKEIDFLDNNIGYVIDFEGRILSTDNSGTDWTILYNTDYELLDIQFLNSQTGFILAKTPEEELFHLLKTTDAGDSFMETEISGGINLREIHFIDSNTGFTLGDHILRTYDSGTGWTELDINSHFWGDLIEKENGDLYACGSGGEFIKSSDDGINWKQVNLNTSSHLYQVTAFQENFYFIGQNFLKSNIQTTWEYEIPAYINDIKVYNNDIVIGFGKQYPEKGFFPYGALYITNNSGKDWETTIFHDISDMRAIDFIDSNSGFGIAYTGMTGIEYLIKIKIEE
ncbi:WD40/YVTN/BNR-like repeat-containing protein [Mangrovivirga cuniculi]|uniref:Photosynthesis system II assembly factor Ycf48/Hcf136-like domain-containing protein n=1 Tax=Mangrovivirga cuniculi TaxID=2715131 RepID=A0A4D7JLH3_9BACT|nr:hypothetical protein [Mangrovivirga cuniculi]QCK15743.1 hypothetical protein DCC35_13820 [Mangrovivirga cuniculi]